MPLDADLRSSLLRSLEIVASSRPEGAIFEYGFEAAEPDALYWRFIRTPRQRQGVGTRLLAEGLAVADRHGVPTWLEADPSGRRDPRLADLVRWYARFGFEIRGLSPQGWVVMRRAPRPWRGGAEAIVADCAEAKATRDLDEAAFRAALARLTPDSPEERKARYVASLREESETPGARGRRRS